MSFSFMLQVRNLPSHRQNCHERNVSMSCQVQKFQYFFTLEISRFSRWQIYKENDPHGEWITNGSLSISIRVLVK